MNESTETQPVSEMHARLLAFRKQVIAEHAKAVAEHEAKLADLDAAIAAIIVRQPAPAAPLPDRRQCGEKGCGGWLVVHDGVWVHERDGGIACFPGHSGPVAQPLDQTTRFPQVTPNGATQVIPAVPYSSFNKELLTWTDGRYAVEVTPNLIDRYEGTWRWTGGVNHLDVPLYESLDEERRPVALRWLIDEKGPLTYSDGRTVEPAEVSDQVTASPAQAEAVRSDG